MPSLAARTAIALPTAAAAETLPVAFSSFFTSASSVEAVAITLELSCAMTCA